MIDGLLPADAATGTFLGRVWRPDLGGPSLVTLRGGMVVDITSAAAPTVSALLERDDATQYVQGAPGETLGPVAELGAGIALLAPCDLQVVKACGVTFAQSMLERVIKERAAGDPDLAEQVRTEVTAIIGGSLRQVVAGSDAAARVKEALIEKGIWSQYLEVGIGPDAEVFTKAPVLSSVGSEADIGLHPISTWNNPEPEIVLAVNSRGEIKGASLGNDINLRDVEGRSALLLGKAKDNNASCSIGPFIRLFDDGYSLDDVRQADLDMEVTGADGFVLFLGTLFAPTEDRDAPGQGFTHHLGDVVRIWNDRLGTLENTVRLSTECPPWEFGMGALMRNLEERGLLG